MKQIYYRAINPAKIAKLCRNFHDPLDIKEAVRPLIRGGCPHFAVVEESKGQFQLLYAGVSRCMGLEHVLEYIDVFKSYAANELIVEDSGLDSLQVVNLVLYGYGIVTCLDMLKRNVEVLILRASNHSKFDRIQKRLLYSVPLDKA